MNRVDRLHAILTVLQSKRVVTADELATRFSISVRTVYRDLRALEEGGVPIGAEAGLGYYISDGYYLPPVMFTKEEARSLLLAGKFLEINSDSATARHINDALTKIRSLLDDEKKEQLESLDQKVLIEPFYDFKLPQRDMSLDVFKEALSNNRVVEIEYKSFEKEEFTTRQLEPTGLCFYFGKWHLIAYCRLRNGYRDFRLDRILGIKILNERFLKIKHPSLKEYIDQLRQKSDVTLCEIVVPLKFHKYLQDTKYQMGLISETFGENIVNMVFAVNTLTYFAKWVLFLGYEVDIVSPEILTDKVKQLCREMSGKYNSIT